MVNIRMNMYLSMTLEVFPLGWFYFNLCLLFIHDACIKSKENDYNVAKTGYKLTKNKFYS